LVGNPGISAADGIDRRHNLILEDEVILHDCDLDRCRQIHDNVLRFALHREPESYGLITATKGAIRRLGEKK
jgi:hypothetical protein